MTRQISIKTRFGWISAFEKKGKIVKVKFGKSKNIHLNKSLKNFKINLNKFLPGQTRFIKGNFLIEGNSTQKRYGKN